MKNVLVTGASGYIGQNLLKHLEKRGCRTYSYDKKINIFNNARIEDLSGYDGVVHLAALSGIPACESDVDQAIIDNILISIKIFEKALESEIPVVFTSSQAVKSPGDNVYTIMKRTVELMAKDIILRRGDIRVLRLANVYGGFEYMRKKNTVIKKFLNKRIKGNVLSIHGDGTQKRDFIHVDDVCEFIWLALNYDDRIFEPVDIGTGVATSMIDLAKKFAHSYAFTDSRNVGAQSSVADTSKAKELFGYQARDKIREYIDTRPDLLS